MYKVDLHTHSDASKDGGLTTDQYQQVLDNGILDYIAVTDHNRIDRALELQQALGERIIVGEEIKTSAGDIIGLYLTENIPSGLTPLETVQKIKEQGGTVYIPHPFEVARNGIHPGVLEEMTDYVELVEICNGRSFMQHRNAQAVVWARLNYKTGVAASDAHGHLGLGRTYTQINAQPNKDNLLELLKNSTLHTTSPSLRSLLYPKYHRLRRKLKKA